MPCGSVVIRGRHYFAHESSQRLGRTKGMRLILALRFLKFTYPKLDKEKNTSIRRKTGAQNIVKEIEQYQQKWLQHVQRMDKNRLPRQALHYRPNGQRNIGRPRKRWADQLHLED